MSERFVNNINNLKFEPFDNYGAPVEGMSWHKISYDKKKWWIWNVHIKNGSWC